MVLDFLSRRKSLKPMSEKDAHHEESHKPILTDEEEKFLEQLTAEEAPPSLPNRPVGKDAQTALMDGADKIPLPTSPPPENEAGTSRGLEAGPMSPTEEDKKKKKSYWSYVPEALSRRKSKIENKMHKDKQPSDSKSEVVLEKETEKEKDELTSVLDQLNLSAVNNRAFSFSKESTELLDKFKLVLKDVVNGVPTAYDDMEKLFTNSEEQMQKLYNGLPPFLQNLVKSLPAKMTAVLGPELLAASAEKPGFDGSKMSSLGVEGLKSGKLKIPSLKSLIAQQGAVAGMLRSILNFLKLRFPAVMTGTNVLMSLAVFLLMFVLWYCHKRGREVRLAKENADSAASASASDIEDSTADIGATPGPSGAVNSPTTATREPMSPSALSEGDLPTVRNLPEPVAAPVPQSPPPEIHEPQKI